MIIDLIAIMYKCEKEHANDLKARKIAFCGLLLDELKEMNGKDLESCLSSISLNQEEKVVTVALNFKIFD